MEPILSKNEITELLVAIKTGKVSADFAGNGLPSPKHILHATEVNLFRSFESNRGNAEMRIPNLDLIIDSFTRKFSTSLTNTLQRNFVLDREEIAITDFQQSLLDFRRFRGFGAVDCICQNDHTCK